MDQEVKRLLALILYSSNLHPYFKCEKKFYHWLYSWYLIAKKKIEIILEYEKKFLVNVIIA